MLVRLLYASRAVAGLSGQMIETILAQSRSKNPGLGITGVLCHGGDVFMQALEGGRGAVNALYNTIARDQRHREVMVLHYEEIEERRFAAWTMAQIRLDRINPSLLLRYSERPVLDPFAVSGRASMAMLEELMATAQVVGRTG